jgi:hypothetical protein
MILSPEIDGINIHSSIIGPIVRQRNNQLHADFRCRIDDFVKTGNIYRRLAILPALEYDFCGSSSFAAVLRQAGWVVGCILVVETPRAENFEAGFLCGC